MGNIISFAQMCDPPLKTGSYKLEVSPETTIQNCQLASESIDITVATNRFLLPPDAIYSVYPPREEVGNYTECLPHIVLNRRTLPWEQQLLSSHPTMPWLALLVFHEDEGIALIEGNCKEAITPEVDVFVPAMTLQDYEKANAPCTYIHIPTDLLSDILPYADDLTLLTHSKGVSLDDKVTDASVKDDWFATVVTNRFCLEPKNESQVLRHIACLVSLEGYEHCLESKEERDKALSGTQTARMIVLSSWYFSMSRAPFDFGSTFASLDAAMMTPQYSGSIPTIQQLSKLGYFPLNHHIRDGSQTVSWYQSPFIPYTEPKHDPRYVRFADQLLAYDPEIGMMDISYASAWQLGKSLALADQAFAQKLYAWRQSNQQTAVTAVYHGLLQLHLFSEPQANLMRWQDHEGEDWNVEVLQGWKPSEFAESQQQNYLGQQFIQARRKQQHSNFLQDVDSDDMIDYNVSEDAHTSATNSKQVLSHQLKHRYRSLLQEVIDHASKE